MENEKRYYVLKDKQKLGPFYKTELLELYNSQALELETELLEETNQNISLLKVVLPELINSQWAKVLHNDLIFRVRDFLGLIFFVLLSIGLHLYLFLIVNEISARRAITGYLITIIAIVSIIFLRAAYYYWSRKRKIIDTPTCKINAATIGTAEFKGRAMNIVNATSLYSNSPYIIYEYRKRTNKEDSNFFNFVESGIVTKPFILEDETGSIPVELSQAKVYLVKKVGEWDYEDPKRGYKERIIAPGENVFILGRVEKINFANGEEKLVISKGNGRNDFLIIRGDEKIVLQKFNQLSTSYLLAGLVGLFLAISLLQF